VTALFEFSASFVDAVAPDVVGMAEDALLAIQRTIEADLPDPDVETYWEGDDFVIGLDPYQTAEEFGYPGGRPKGHIRAALMMSVPEAQRLANQVVADE
jgi:hypothetical protein